MGWLWGVLFAVSFLGAIEDNDKKVKIICAIVMIFALVNLTLLTF